MRIVHGHGNLINKLSTQSLDSASGGEIVGVAGNRDRPRSQPDKWCNGSTRLQCVAVTSKTLGNLKANVTGANSNVLRISDPKIYVPGIYPIAS